MSGKLCCKCCRITVKSAATIQLNSGLPRSMPNADQNSGIDPNVDHFRSMLINSSQLIRIDWQWSALRGIWDQCHDFDQHWSALGIDRESIVLKDDTRLGTHRFELRNKGNCCCSGRITKFQNTLLWGGAGLTKFHVSETGSANSQVEWVTKLSTLIGWNTKFIMLHRDHLIIMWWLYTLGGIVIPCPCLHCRFCQMYACKDTIIHWIQPLYCHYMP